MRHLGRHARVRFSSLPWLDLPLIFIHDLILSGSLLERYNHYTRLPLYQQRSIRHRLSLRHLL